MGGRNARVQRVDYLWLWLVVPEMTPVDGDEALPQPRSIVGGSTGDQQPTQRLRFARASAAQPLHRQ